ncbi:MAG: AmmeMemoRadiSam system protein B [Candidatus Uhrbacteria bacterium]|nr:AmmeMemoRadiSam system protein B [Candidatus Uhrbacteria bacterium]
MSLRAPAKQSQNRFYLGMLILICFLFGIRVARYEPVSVWENSNHRFSYALASPSLYDSANATAQDIDRTGARSGIVAHHLLVGDKIAQTFAAMGTGREKTVIILSPNHFDLGYSPLQTTDGTWETPYGDVEVDTEVLQKLLGSGLDSGFLDQASRVEQLAYEPETFEHEHGVSAIMPFVKRWFPDARIVPIVIHDDVAAEGLVDLAYTIQEVAPRAVVIASIDMSHNLPEHMQIPHDEETLAAIERGDCGGSECRLEIDANGVLETLFLVNQLRGTQEWNLTHHGSSLAMGATTDWRENTSHILGYFERGEPVEESFVSIQFVGDVMLDRGVRDRIESQGVDYPWRDVERFLQGAQVRVANLEGTISEDASVASVEPPFRFTFAPEFVEAMLPFIDVVSLANNHSRDRDFGGEFETQKWLEGLELGWFGGYAAVEPVYRFGRISIVGYHQFGFHYPDLTPIIEREARNGQFVIVYPHWGEEYIAQPQDGQRELAAQMVQAGADLIIGGHPHVVQGIESIDGVPVVYSLGNFVFDQVAPGTDVGLSVTVLFYEDGGMIYLSPVETRDGQPTPLSDEEGHTLFQNIASLSSEDIAPYVLKGMIPFD